MLLCFCINYLFLLVYILFLCYDENNSFKYINKVIENLLVFVKILYKLYIYIIRIVYIYY